MKWKLSWRSLARDVAIVLILVAAIGYWQTKDLLTHAEDRRAPEFSLQALDGQTHSLSEARGSTVILYFFAPWCPVCHASIGNLETLAGLYSAKKLQIFYIALSYESVKDVTSFVSNEKLTHPVLLGNDSLAQQYRISVFPTYYVVDENGTIRRGVVGYSTLAGLWARLLLL